MECTFEVHYYIFKFLYSLSFSLGYQFILKATDSGGLSAFTILSFKKLEKIPKVGFEVEMEIECSFAVVAPFLNDIFQIINKISLFFGDSNSENIKVVDFYEKAGYPSTVILKWTNCTFDFTSTCPNKGIAMMRQKISSDDSFVKIFEPNYKIKRIGFVYHSPCEEPITTLPPATTPIPSPPKVVNYIPTIITKQCARLLFPIPQKTFYDKEDGWTSNLTLSLLSVNDETLLGTDWIKLNEDRQSIEGIPAKLSNIASPFQSFIYNLVAMDRDGHKASLVIRIDVMANDPNARVNQNFTLVLRNNFPINIPDVIAYKIQLKSKIASFYGDNDPYFIQESYFDASKNSLTISWSNCTINGPTCNTTLAKMIKDKIMDNNGKCRSQFAFIFLPEFTVQQLEMDAVKDCELSSTSLPISSTISPTLSTVMIPSSTSSLPKLPSTIRVLVEKINIDVDYCQQINYEIPENIFVDSSNGNSRSFNYTLLFEDQLDVTCNSWLQLNTTSNLIYGNILRSQIVSPTTYKLKASNAEGSSAITNIQIDTTQSEKVNISYRAAFSFQTIFNESICDAEVLAVLKSKLANYFKDNSTEYTNFIYFSRGSKQVSSYVMWTNCTIRADECDFLRINYISSKLFIEETSTPNPQLVEALKPEFTQLSVLEEKLGPCDANEVLSVGSELPTICVDTCGEFEFHINTSVFIENRNPNRKAQDIIIEVTDSEGMPISSDSWITFHQKGNHFLGFPTKETVENEPEGGYRYLIHAYDSQGATANVPITFKMCNSRIPEYDGSVTVQLACNKTITKAIDLVHDTLVLLTDAYYDGTLNDFFIDNYNLNLEYLNFTWANCSGSAHMEFEQLSSLLNGSGCRALNVTKQDHKDYPPKTITKNLRFQVSHCHPKNYSIPHDSIIDSEDGDLRNMTTYLVNQNKELLPWNSSVALHRSALEVIFMTTNQTKTNTIYEYYLIARDKQNQTAEILLFFEVMDAFPDINFQVTTQLRVHDNNNIPLVQSINEYLEAINKYTKTNNTWLVVRYKGFKNKTISISYTMCGLAYPKCSHSKIDSLKDSLQTTIYATGETTINSNLATSIFPRITIEDLNILESGDCLLEPNTPPRTQKQTLNVTVTRCGVTRFQIPEDTWSDKQSGGTRNLTLKVHTTQGCWWSFNKTKQEFTFLYDSKLAGLVINFTIEAIDGRDESSNTTLTVMFEASRKSSYQLVFLFNTINPLKDCFDEKLYFLKTFIEFFNGTENLTLTSVSDGPEMTEVVYEHCDMRPEPCDFIIMDRLVNALLDGNTLKDNFIRYFQSSQTPTRYRPAFLAQRKAEVCFDRSNNDPQKNGDLPVFNVTMCYNQSRFVLPRGLVTDTEDGDWMNLRKTLYQTSITTKTEIINSPWIELMEDSLELTYIQNIADFQPEGGYTFEIVVTDSRGSTVGVPFKVFFEQIDKDKRNITFTVKSTLEIDNRKKDVASILRRWKNIVETNLSISIGVVKIVEQNSNNVTIEWTKCGQNPQICPYTELNRIEKSTNMSREQLWRITKYGRCLEPPSRPPNGTDVRIIFDPCLKINYTIPDSMFTDDRDGGSRNLKITATQTYPAESATFIQYHEDDQQFLGIVLLGFFDKYNSLDFLLQATDSEGLKGNAKLIFVAKNKIRQYEFKTRAVYFGSTQTVTSFATEFCFRFEAYLRGLNLNEGVMIYNASRVTSFTYDITVTPCAMTGQVCDRDKASSIIDKLIIPPVQLQSGFVRAMLDKIVPETVRLVNTSACTKEPWNYGNKTSILKAGVCNKQTYTWQDFFQNVANSTMIIFENLEPLWMIFNRTKQQLLLRPTLRELQSQPLDGYMLYYQVSNEGMVMMPKQNLSVVIDGEVEDYNFMMILHLKKTRKLESQTSQRSLLMDIQRRIDVLTDGTRFNHTTVVRVDGNETTSSIKAYLYDCNLDSRFCNIISNEELAKIFINTNNNNNIIQENVSNVFDPEYNIANITTLTSGACLEIPEDEPYVTAEIPPIQLSMCGKTLFKLPKGLFMDKKDGIIKGRNIELCDIKGEPVNTTVASSSSIFIRYAADESMIQVMLTHDQLKKFSSKVLVFYLKANNSVGNTANTSLILQLPSVPERNLLIKTQVTLPKDRNISDFDVLLEVCQRIEQYLQTKENSSISVVSFNRETEKEAVLEWTTCDLIRKNCSKDQVKKTLDSVFSSDVRVHNSFFVHALGRDFGYTPDKSTSRELNYCLHSEGNTPPISKKNITIIIQLCGYFEKKLDNDTFVDVENGDISNLKLTMKFMNGSLIPDSYWIKYDDQKKIIYGIPTDDVRLRDNGTRFVFLLEAVDDSDAVVDGSVFVYLNESATKLHLDHDKGITKLDCRTDNDDNKQSQSLETVVKVLNRTSIKINSDLSEIYLKRFFFTNDSMLIIEWLSCGHLNLTTSKEITGTKVDDCTVTNIDIIPKPLPTTTTTTKAPTAKITEDTIIITCGHPNEYKLKKELFEDPDNITVPLTLEVLDDLEQRMENYTYMSFNRVNQTVTSFISAKDCSKIKVNESFTLQSSDKDGNSVKSTFTIREIPKTISCCIQIKLQVDPLVTPQDKYKFFNRLKTVYPNNVNSQLALVDIYRNRTKDIVIYTNHSITNKTCTDKKIQLLTDPVFEDVNYTQVKPNFVSRLQDYSPVDVEGVYHSECQKIPVVTPITSAQKGDFFFTPHWFWYLLPLFILAFMLLVCCLCYYCCRYCYNCCLARTPKDAGLLANETRYTPSPIPYSILPKEAPYSDKDSLDALGKPGVGSGPESQPQTSMSDKIIALPVSQFEVPEMEPKPFVAKPIHIERRPIRSSVIQEEFIDQQEEEQKIDFDQRFDNIDARTSRNSSQRNTRISTDHLLSREAVTQRLATSRPVTTSYIGGKVAQQQQQQQMTQQSSFTTATIDNRNEHTRRIDTRRNLRLPAIPAGPPPPYSPPRFQRIIRQNVLPNYYERYLRHNRKHRDGGGTRDGVIIPITETDIIQRRVNNRVLTSPPTTMRARSKQKISLPIMKRRKKKEIERIITPVITIPETPQETTTESIITDDSQQSIEMKAIIKGKQHSIRKLLLQSPLDGATPLIDTTPLVRNKKKRPKKSVVEIPPTFHQYGSKIKRRYSVASPISKISTKDVSTRKRSSSSKLKHRFAKPFIYDYVPVKRRSIRKKRYRVPVSNEEQTKDYSTLSRSTRKKLPTLEELLDDSLDINDRVDLSVIKKPTDSLRKKRNKLKNESQGSWIDLKDINLKE